jgi:hypothetical protein
MIADFGETLRQRGPWWYRRLFWEAGTVGQVLYLEAEAAGIRSTGIGCYFDDACHAVLGLKDDQFQSLYHFTVGGPVDDPRLTTLPATTYHGPARRRQLMKLWQDQAHPPATGHRVRVTLIMMVKSRDTCSLLAHRQVVRDARQTCCNHGDNEWLHEPESTGLGSACWCRPGLQSMGFNNVIDGTCT